MNGSKYWYLFTYIPPCNVVAVYILVIVYHLFWCQRLNILALGVSTMPADALATLVDMLFTV